MNWCLFSQWNCNNPDFKLLSVSVANNFIYKWFRFYFRTLMCGLIGSFLTEMFNWRIPFFVIGCMAIFWSVFVFQKILAVSFNNGFSSSIVYPRFLSKSIRVISSPVLSSATCKSSDNIQGSCEVSSKLTRFKGGAITFH